MEEIFFGIVLYNESFLLISTYLEDVPDGHGGHVDHDQADVPVRQLLRRLREQQRPLLGEVRHACTKYLVKLPKNVCCFKTCRAGPGVRCGPCPPPPPPPCALRRSDRCWS